jgi:hypothetical protein
MQICLTLITEICRNVSRSASIASDSGWLCMPHLFPLSRAHIYPTVIWLRERLHWVPRVHVLATA